MSTATRRPSGLNSAAATLTVAAGEAGDAGVSGMFARRRPVATSQTRARRSETVSTLFLPVVRGLEIIAKRGIVHRDLKPSNILLKENARPIINDFGMAGLEHVILDIDKGLVMGTPRYISPDQAQGEAIDQRSDIFTLGFIFYSILTGNNPYPDENNLMRYISMVAAGAFEITPIKDLRPEVDGCLASIIHTMLEPYVDRRYPTHTKVYGDMLGYLWSRKEG